MFYIFLKIKIQQKSIDVSCAFKSGLLILLILQAFQKTMWSKLNIFPDYSLIKRCRQHWQ